MRRGDVILMDFLEAFAGKIISALMISLRWRIVDGYKDAVYHRKCGAVIWAFWHGQLMAPAYVGRHRGARILISRSRDGEIMSCIGKGLGIESVRGSTSRGGLEGLVELTRSHPKQDLAIAADGPRGPREVAQPGIIYLAQATGRPILPLVSSAYPCLRLGSWDRFMVPLPFGRLAVAVGESVHVPADASAKDREGYRLELEEKLKRATGLIEAVARERVEQRRYARNHSPYPAYDQGWATTT